MQAGNWLTHQDNKQTGGKFMKTKVVIIFLVVSMTLASIYAYKASTDFRFTIDTIIQKATHPNELNAPKYSITIEDFLYVAGDGDGILKVAHPFIKDGVLTITQYNEDEDGFFFHKKANSSFILKDTRAAKQKNGLTIHNFEMMLANGKMMKGFFSPSTNLLVSYYGTPEFYATFEKCINTISIHPTPQ